MICPFGGFAKWLQRKTFWQRTQKTLGLGRKLSEPIARSDGAWAWLDATLTVDELTRLLPETAVHGIERHRFPALRALNFVIHDLLEEGVAASSRQDAQAKSLGEWLRSRVVAVPAALLGNSGR